jgi:hypothetical protein
MVLIEEVIQNLNIIIGLLLQGIGIAIYDRLSTIMHLSIKIKSSKPENPSRKEKTAINLANDVDERLRILKRYFATHLLLDIITMIIGPWYVFVAFIPLISVIQLSFLFGMRNRGYFRFQ